MGGGSDGLVLIITFAGTAIKYAQSAYKGVKIAMPSFVIQPGLLSGLSNSATNGIGVSAWSQPATAKSVPGVSRYWKEAGSAAGSTYNYYDNSVLGWLGIHFIANVASTISGPITKSSILKALKSASNVDMYGVMPPWNASKRGKRGAVPCSPYHVFVPETLQNGLQVATYRGVFLDPLTGKTAYVDPGFKAPRS
jgi:hypothetical protein